VKLIPNVQGVPSSLCSGDAATGLVDFQAASAGVPGFV
jgi:hypothetical protein